VRIITTVLARKRELKISQQVDNMIDALMLD